MKKTYLHRFSSKQSYWRQIRYSMTIISAVIIVIGLFLSTGRPQNSKSTIIHSFLLPTVLMPLPVQAQTAPTATQKLYLPTIFNSVEPNNAGSIVFVSRRIPTKGSDYYVETGSLPGVGPYSRFRVAAPGKLIIREPDGILRTLIDGSQPSPASLNLIDVNAPDVSYDGTKIVFAGLPNGQYNSNPRQIMGAWRIYIINVDGTGLQQVTFSDQGNLNLSQFDPINNFQKYDDTDPIWLPDGRIVLSSTRWPSLGMYQDARTTNLYVVNANGSGLHRITAERNGADRPLVDPLTGKIVYSRWWRNFRQGTNNMGTVLDPLGGYRQYLGLVAESQSVPLGSVPGADQSRNSWQLATINPDGTDLAQWTGVSGIGFSAFENQAYGGSFTQDGTLYTNYFPMFNLAEADGFGGIRRYQRGPHGYTGIVGIFDDNHELARLNPPSHHVFKGAYAAEPEVLPDGRLIVSWAADVRQDYGLYLVNADGSGLTLLYDNSGTTELRSRLIRPRPLPPIIPDQITQVASLLPPTATGPYDIDGTFMFDALNVYFNAPVDVDIASAMPVGSAGTIRFFIDHQRKSAGFREGVDWPILLQEAPINSDGSVSVPSPANVPLFEQIRTTQPGYTIPVAGTNYPHGQHGAAHVAGLNFGRPGADATCVGCHAGHSMIPVPQNPADAKWTNLATGAAIAASSSDPNFSNGSGLIDRRVLLNQGGNGRYWKSSSGQAPTSQWIQLTFPVPVTVRTVRLYNLPSNLQVQVNDATIKLYSDAAATNQVAIKTSGSLSGSGTNVPFADVQARVVRIEFNSVTGNAAGLAEVEVIARGEAGP
jgi:hypothetical protein